MFDNILSLILMILVATALVGLAEAVSPKLGTVAETLVVGAAALLVLLFVLAVVFTGLWISLREILPF